MPKPRKTYSKELKLQIINTAHDIGRTQASSIYDVPKKTLDKWLKIFKEKGPEGFEKKKRSQANTKKNKSHTIRFRVNEKEYFQLIQSYSRKDSTSLSSELRGVLLSEATRERFENTALKLDAPSLQALKNCALEINRIGNLMNQLIKNTYVFKTLSETDQKTISVQIENLNQELKNIKEIYFKFIN